MGSACRGWSGGGFGEGGGAFAATREEHGDYELDFRILHDGVIRWISARGKGEDEGIVGWYMYGVFLDVTARKFYECTP